MVFIEPKNIFRTKLMKTNSYLEKTYEVSLEVDLLADPYKCLGLVLKKISQIGLRNGRIKLIDSGEYVTDNKDGSISGRLREGMIDRVARKGTPLIAPLDEGEMSTNGETACLICVPVRCGHGTVAVLAAERENPDQAILEKDLQLLSVMSSLLIDPVQRINSGSDPGDQSIIKNNENLSLTSRVENFERDLIIDALRKSRGNQTKAAELLGVSLRIINYRIGKLNLDYRSFRKVN